MKKITKHDYSFLISLVLLITGCENNQFDYPRMKSSEANFMKGNRKTLLAYMSLNTMFPNPNTRALAEVAGKGQIDKVEDLVRSGINVNGKGSNGATPLFWAFKNYKGFTRLLELGANPNVVYGDGGTIMSWATKHKDNRFLQSALKHGGSPNLKDQSVFRKSPLFDALGSNSKMDILLEAGADIDSADSFGFTPIMSAAGRGDFETVHYLLKKGADCRIKNNAGKTLVDKVNNKVGAFRSGSQQQAWLNKVAGELKRKGLM